MTDYLIATEVEDILESCEYDADVDTYLRYISTTQNELKYLDLMSKVLQQGKRKQDRTGTGTISLFGNSVRFDVSDYTIPLLTSKNVHFPSIAHEVLWYLSGDSNIEYLRNNNVRIWNEWATEEGELGPVYGVQWRHWQGAQHEIDQINQLVADLIETPDSRRMMVTAWNPSVVPPHGMTSQDAAIEGYQALPPCHYSFQVYTEEMSKEEQLKDLIAQRRSNQHNPRLRTRKMSLLLNQRSCDYFLGGAFNIASYTLILRMLCEVVNYAPGELIWNIGDTHIYNNHVEQVKLQLSRVSEINTSPILRFTTTPDSMDDFKYGDIVIDGYQSLGTISAKVSV